MSADTHVEKPVCVSLVSCEYVIVNAQSNNKTFIEAFTDLYCETVPASASRLCIVASLTNIVGKAQCSIHVTAPSGKEVFAAEGPVEAESPLHAIDLVFELHGLELPEEGTYHIDVRAGTEHIIGRPFTLHTVGQPTA